MNRLLHGFRIARSRLPRLRFRLGTMMVLVALLAASLAFLTNKWRREKREAVARRILYRADARKQRAMEYREQSLVYLGEFDRLRKSSGFGGGAAMSNPFPPGYGELLHQAQINHAMAMAKWAETMAKNVEWAAEHPAEPLRPEPPRPGLRRPAFPIMPPAPVPHLTRQLPVSKKVGQTVVPRVVKNPE